jgi:glycosyltransferase involved in cell wall biosynthesis
VVNDPTVPIPIRRPQLSDLTPFILAWNEEANIARCLDSLAWAAQILIVDSGSTDRTLEIAAKYPQVRVVQRPFDCHSNQGNFGLGQIRTSWVLSLDADYILTPEFQRALQEGAFAWEEDCIYYAPFRFCVFGRPLRGSLYPPRGVMYALKGAHYDQDGHTQRIAPAGKRAVMLPYAILHDDRKSTARWLSSQEKYARLEAEKLSAAPKEGLKIQDRLRLTGWIAPLIVAPYALFARGLILDGWPGMFYALQRMYAELLLALFLLEKRLRGD